MNEHITNTTRPVRRHAARRNYATIAPGGRSPAGVLTARELRTEVLAILG